MSIGLGLGMLKATPWLSVIIPSYNGERWLAEALQSIAQQADPGIEVIFIDSSASEDSLRIAAAFSGSLNLRVYRRPDLASWTAKTNFGVEEARASWISMLHQDDCWLPSRAAALREWIAAQPDAVVHVHPAYIIDARGKRRGIWRCPLPTNGLPVPSAALTERLLVQNFVAIPTAAIRREAFLEVGGMDEALWYTADWDLYLKLTSRGCFCYHKGTFAAFRIHPGSQTTLGTRNSVDFRDQLETVLGRYIGELEPAALPHIARLAHASIELNLSLASLGRGQTAGFFKTLYLLLALGPRGISEYLRYSRIIERALPRLRARIAGVF